MDLETKIQVLCKKFTQLHHQLEDTALYHEYRQSDESTSVGIFKHRKIDFNRYDWPVINDLYYNTVLKS